MIPKNSYDWKETQKGEPRISVSLPRKQIHLTGRLSWPNYWRKGPLSPHPIYAQKCPILSGWINTTFFHERVRDDSGKGMPYIIALRSWRSWQISKNIIVMAMETSVEENSHLKKRTEEPQAISYLRPLATLNENHATEQYRKRGKKKSSWPGIGEKTHWQHICHCYE